MNERSFTSDYLNYLTHSVNNIYVKMTKSYLLESGKKKEGKVAYEGGGGKKCPIGLSRWGIWDIYSS